MKAPTTLRAVLTAALLLAGAALPAFAASDLFDNEYTDCPAATRLRGGEIGNLTISRSDTDAKTAVLHWDTTDPSGWGLGGNAYTTSLVALVDDGKTKYQTLSLSVRKATFTGLATGAKLKAQLAIVTEVSGDKYLISDIIEARLGGTLDAPGFSSPWMKVAQNSHDTGRHMYGPGKLDASVGAVPARVADGLPTAKSAGSFWYVGYGEAFHNYRAGAGMGFVTKPDSPKLRIGLRHAGTSTETALEDVNFKAYIIRIVDSDGDVIVDDFRTRAANYGTMTACNANTCIYGPSTLSGIAPQIFFYDVKQVSGSNMDLADQVASPASNVRVVDGAYVVPAFAINKTVNPSATSALPDDISNWGVGWKNTAAGMDSNPSNDGDAFPAARGVAIGTIFAPLPDEYRDLPARTLRTDETYTISAWAVNDLGDTISPRTVIKVRPKETATTKGWVQGTASGNFNDYLNSAGDVTCANSSCTLIVTEFTVIIPQD